MSDSISNLSLDDYCYNVVKEIYYFDKPQEQRVQIDINHYSSINTKVQYMIEFQVLNTLQQSLKRFSEIEMFQQNLKLRYQNSKKIPDFPSKTFKNVSKNLDYLNNRMESLKNWFNLIISDSQLINEIREFVDTDQYQPLGLSSKNKFYYWLSNDQIISYNIMEFKWKIVQSNIQDPIYNISKYKNSILIDGSIQMIGGIESEMSPLNVVIFNPESNVISKQTNLTLNGYRTNHGLIQFDNYIQVIGGTKTENNDEYIIQIEQFSQNEIKEIDQQNNNNNIQYMSICKNNLIFPKVNPNLHVIKKSILILGQINDYLSIESLNVETFDLQLLFNLSNLKLGQQFGSYLFDTENILILGGKQFDQKNVNEAGKCIYKINLNSILDNSVQEQSNLLKDNQFYNNNLFNDGKNLHCIGNENILIQNYKSNLWSYQNNNKFKNLLIKKDNWIKFKEMNYII